MCFKLNFDLLFYCKNSRYLVHIFMFALCGTTWGFNWHANIPLSVTSIISPITLSMITSESFNPYMHFKCRFVSHWCSSCQMMTTWIGVARVNSLSQESFWLTLTCYHQGFTGSIGFVIDLFSVQLWFFLLFVVLASIMSQH